jgi:hypothetical protein
VFDYAFYARQFRAEFSFCYYRRYGMELVLFKRKDRGGAKAAKGGRMRSSFGGGNGA